MKQQLRDIFPYQWKLQFRLLQRFCNEKKTSYNYSKNYIANDIGGYKNQIHQPIRKGDLYENKIHNLKIVNDRINHLIINPNEVFSFWKLVGKPSEKNNFKKGRNLISNNLSQDFGGGICQFSSILYYLALKSGLKIIERHHHSIDIYKENERFTPLGSDCTVVYGYKDLQIKNNFLFPVQFKCSVTENELHVMLISSEEIIYHNVEFKYLETHKGIWVETLSNNQTLFKNFYIRL